VPVQDVRTIDEYDAVVFGSAIHMFQWMKPASEFVARETATLASIPVWLFSSGPVTDRSKPHDPADRLQGDQIAKALAAREHRVFRGKIDKSGLGVAERAIVRITKAPSGVHSEDQRDWDAIRTRAAGIGMAVLDSQSSVGIRRH
jgi:menaquinone-dependent protoporphyrinogen oxidase